MLLKFSKTEKTWKIEDCIKNVIKQILFLYFLTTFCFGKSFVHCKDGKYDVSTDILRLEEENVSSGTG